MAAVSAYLSQKHIFRWRDEGYVTLPSLRIWASWHSDQVVEHMQSVIALSSTEEVGLE